VSVFVDVMKEILLRNRDRHVIPVLDGPMRPNARLDESPVLTEEIPSPDDIAVSTDGAVWATGGNTLYRFANADFVSAPARFDLGGPVTALASNPEGGVAAAIPGLGVILVEDGGSQRLVRLEASASLDCPTALTFGPDGALFVCDGSRDNPPDRWVYDLMQKRNSGRVLRIDQGNGGVSVLAEGLRWPNGICVASDRSRLIVTEAWSHSILELPFKRANERPNRLAENLPGYAARIIPFGDGYCMTYFALRTQLVDFVLAEDSYRNKMIERIEPAFWIAPSLRSEGHYLEPVQGGGLRKHGSVNAWAPPRSYGLVVVTDADFEPLASYHSRVGGSCHGVTGLASQNGRSVIVAAKGASKIVQISTERPQ
jgi:sugar lactone lactonase YvrE